ncbi:MAG: phage holin family protein [candidate division NC10 bacterium]|nr:phage holin family protein [candidate division NC10 bacterium]MBI2456824.1 phage holin family protein [candidate division NC10 bacterium]MBI3122571.1 phage holin family protein [candidate division NC10 bacterium]MBI4735283.1 phage holin family protein [candidate division NC10 bacterium]
MPAFVIRWVATALAIGVAAQVLPGIQVDGLWAASVAALLLGLVNVTLRPILLLLTLPLTVVTLGLFALVVNGAMLALVASVVKGVHVAGFGSAVLGAILISLVGSLLTWLLQPRPRVHVEVRRFTSVP